MSQRYHVDIDSAVTKAFQMLFDGTPISAELIDGRML